jgi:16S rRNA (cytosine967-C5)-methyltransferase
VSDSRNGARPAALTLLQAVLRGRRSLDEAWQAALGPGGELAALSARDRAFTRLLVATTLRRLGQIDAALAPLLNRPLPQLAPLAHDALRLGAAQLLFLATPAHAAVDRTVQLLRRQRPLAGLANAVLRRLSREGQALLALQDAARLNCPDWLWASWTAAYGEPATRAIMEQALREPPLDLAVIGNPDEWLEPLQAEKLPTGTLRRTAGGAVGELPGYAAGAWWVQDAAASLPARLLGPVAGRRVLDLCSAPGGKTAQLAAAGAQVTAVDIAEQRQALTRANLQRLRLAAEIVVADIMTWRPPAPAELVLLDAPCTATGTLRRHPDVIHLKRPADVQKQAALQASLLDGASAMLAPGGRLVYAVCSLQPEEGPAQVEALLARRPALRRDPVAGAELPGLADALTPEGDLRILPCHWAERGGLDGFYIARLRAESGSGA